MDLKESLRDFTPRVETVRVTDIFPDIDGFDLMRTFNPKQYSPQNKNPHQAILELASNMWNGGFEDFFESYGFYDGTYEIFDGHCHQITPALMVILEAAKFSSNIAYLECFRVDPETGEKISPEEEKSDMKGEFCEIGRIPYCCLEVGIDGETFHFSGKHIVPNEGEPRALLTPDCYEDMVGVFPHQFDKSKSGIYLAQVKDKPWIKEGEPFVWMKQKVGDNGQPLEPMEYFRAYSKIVLK